jgi:NAD(P)-dependent dehydrogenase (short-subunit alcohol dehydrogenase family)
MHERPRTDGVLQGRHVVVVGGTSGIGLGLARACLARGARVTLVGRGEERLARARAELDPGAPVEGVLANVAAESDVVRLFARTGPVDHVASTVIDAEYSPVRELDVAAAQRTIGGKLLGALLLAKHGAPRLAPGGSITFTSGVAAHRPAPGGALVAALNAGLATLAGALAVELAPVRVNVVSPGWVDTPAWERIAGERRAAVLAERAARNPAGRLAVPDDVAGAFLFLMQSALVTGAVLEVDGGQRWT